jgi:transcriptional regulator with XRE-family HTH domain
MLAMKKPIKSGGTELTGAFRHRLRQARIDAGLSQSDLARMIWGETVDNKGYTTARNRDRISSYELGRSVPSKDNLELVAKALEVSADQLGPDILAARAERGQETAPAIHMTMIEGKADAVRLQTDIALPLALATKIISLVSQHTDEAANASVAKKTSKDVLDD